MKVQSSLFKTIIKTKEVDKIDYSEKSFTGGIKVIDSTNKVQTNMFKFFEAFFSESDSWDDYTNKEKENFGFMLFRFLSIEYPTTIFNIGGLYKSVGVINALHNIFKVMDYPRWMYIDGKVKTKNNSGIELKLSKYPKILIDKIKEIHQMDNKDFKLFIELFEKEFLTFLESETHAMNFKK